MTAVLLSELRKLSDRVSLLEAGRHVTKRMDVQMHDVQRFVSDGKRVVRGVATMPAVDRLGDIVDPMGGQWDLPLPLLWQHKHDQPIGWVREAKATRDGVQIVAEIAKGIGVADQAWEMIEARLVDSFSIGFVALEWEHIDTGKRFTRWLLHEISVVTIPALPGAKITATKSASAGVKLIDMRGAVKLIKPGISLRSDR